MERFKKTVLLNKFESGFYITVWIVAVSYSIYNMYLTNTYFNNYHDPYGDFSPGWGWLGGKRDRTDHEWRAWIPLLFQSAPWILLHILGGQIVKYHLRTDVAVCLWYTIIAIAFLVSYMGVSAMLALLVQPCISCLLRAIRIRTVSWIANIFYLVLLNLLKQFPTRPQQWLRLQEEEYYMLLLAMCWVQLRSISYSIDSLDTPQHNEFREFLVELTFNVAYCFYLPTLFLGPVILYEEFRNGIKMPYESWNIRRVSSIFFNISRYIFWLYFTELSMHFLYFNAMQYHPQFVQTLNPWAFYGFGYCMGQYFFNKYTVVYGIASSIVRAENITTIQPPKCIGRIHLYSDMWKHFDTGLYKFLVKYIYVPLSGSKDSSRKFLASFSCFTFVFVWHGTQMYIFVWSLLNFLGLTIETLARSFGKSEMIINIERKMFTSRNARRFKCALASPLLAMSAISNFYFFGGQDIGNIFMRRIVTDSWGIILSLMFFLYCCCQTSTDMKFMESRESQSVKIT